jgi:Transposase Tn5 dimerisation domain/Transposase DNA-binding
MQQLTLEDFPGLQLGDKRRNGRLLTIVNNVIRQPGSSIPKQNAGWYPTKATYSFFANKKIPVDALENAVEAYGLSQVSEEKQLLILHDITYISYGDLQCEGLGHLTYDECKGVVCMNALAVSLQGWPLTLLHQHLWTRSEVHQRQNPKHKQRPFEQKESYEWYKDIQHSNEKLGEEVQKIHICDCEGDDYELFFFAYEPNTKLLIRSGQNRKIEQHEALLWDHIGSLEPAGEIALSIPDAKGHKRVGIQAEVRYERVKIARPLSCKSPYKSVELWAIEVTQVDEKQSWQQEIIDWKLLTNIDIASLQDVLQCVRWYSFRWLVERFHYVMKSGTGMENLRLGKALALQKAIHTYSIAAMQIMKALYLSRETPEVSCEVVLTKTQWAVLYILIHKTATLPQNPPTLAEAVKWIARLGGHLGRKGDGPPGLKTFWSGYQRIMDAACLFDTLFDQDLGKR